MKMFKRLAAVLLAGVMVLAMLTACGKTLVQQVEDAGMKNLNSALSSMNVTYENDPELHDKIYEALGHIAEDGTLDQQYFPEDAQIAEPTEDGTYTRYFLIGSNGKAMEVEKVTSSGKIVLASTQASGKTFAITSIDKVAVAAREVNGKTYMGIAEVVTGKMVENSPVVGD